MARWEDAYNRQRPHSALGYMTPAAFAGTFTATGGRLRNPDQLRRPPVAPPASLRQSQPKTLARMDETWGSQQGQPASARVGWLQPSAIRPAGTIGRFSTSAFPGCSRNWRSPAATGVIPRLLRSLGRADLLILDDWGLEPLDAAARHDLLEILEERYGRRSTVITSQLPVDRWHEVIGDPTYADAILDRLIHNAHRIELTGDSLRRTRERKSGRLDLKRSQPRREIQRSVSLATRAASISLRWAASFRESRAALFRFTRAASS